MQVNDIYKICNIPEKIVSRYYQKSMQDFTQK